MTSILARRYASALFSAAAADGDSASVGRDLQTLAERLADPAAREAALAPDRPSSLREQALAALTAGMHELVRNLGGVLLARHREALLPDLAPAYRALELEARGETSGEVLSPRPLGAAELARAEALARELTGRHVHLTAAIRPELLGGVQLRIGNTLYDASLATALDELRTHLLAVELPA
jgi:F-type H+-transporting ATPase subunit delta